MNRRDILEKFITDPDLEQLEGYLAEFNAFDVLKLAPQEIRHSNFLAWLLDPRQNHALGDYFLKRFLSSTLSSARKSEASAITPIDIDIWDLSESLVAREWNKIDILIVNDGAKVACAP